MRHPFVVGETYRNRDGEYEVVKLDGTKMVIRYADGREIETDVVLQARIRDNMRAERVIRAEALKRSARKSYRSSHKRVTFTGLLEGDFQRGTAGTTWRARTGLGGLLAQRLSARAQHEFLSYAIYRRAEVHIARPDCYHNAKKRGCRDAKFVFDLDAEGARYGLYVEKSDSPMDETWHWPNLMAALASDEALQESTLTAMRGLALEWELCLDPSDEPVTRVAAGEAGLEWRPAEGEASVISWPEFVQRLSEIDEGTWCNLYLCARLDKTEAIAAGAGIAETAVAAYCELLPLYDAAVGKSGS
jgi:hypothetical protein